MFRLVVAIISVCLACQIQAQDPAIQKFYDQYKGLDNVEDIQIKGWVLKLAGSFADEEKAQTVLQKISRLRVMTMENGNLVTPKAYKDLVRQVRNRQFEDLIQFKDAGESVQVMIREQGNRITDVLLLVNGTDNFTLLSLEGTLTFSDLKSLQIEMEGAEHFKRIPADRKDIPRA